MNPEFWQTATAVDKSAQGERLGQAPLFHAFERSAGIAEQLGIYAVEVMP